VISRAFGSVKKSVGDRRNPPGFAAFHGFWAQFESL
jgi:hypothetical protein